MPLELESWIGERIQRVNRALERLCPDDGSALTAAMRYSLLAGGKRLRPLLCLAGAEAVGADSDAVLDSAAALEMIHTFSLIHDDLPAMDDDDLRRGHPTCHVQFGEAIAILAGDALHSLAFGLVAHEPGVVQTLALACQAMCRGQVDDIVAEGQVISLEQLRTIHVHKTGALLKASVVSGALTAPESQVSALGRYGESIGIAFQIVDDILDITGDDATLGKPAGSDLKHDKATYPKLVGLDESKRLARAAQEDALAALEIFGTSAEALRAIARYIVERNT